jgi:hypothetical protein
METASAPGFDARAGAGRRDQLQTLVEADGLPVTYQAFKFESRRSRIDWRLLHGVDINKLVSTNPTTPLRHITCLQHNCSSITLVVLGMPSGSTTSAQRRTVQCSSTWLALQQL